MLLTLTRNVALQRLTQARCGSLRFLSAFNKDSKHASHSEIRTHKHDDDDCIVIEEQKPVIIKPIRQELIKTIPVEYHGVPPALFNDQSEWIPIFRWPYLNATRIMVKFKVYLTAFSFINCLIYGSQMLFIAGDTPWKAAMLSTITLTGLVFIGDYARRLIMQIYVSPTQEYVRFCRFTFFGRRRDMVVAKDCIVRLPEVNSNPKAPIFDVKFRMPEEGVDLDYDHYEFYELGFRLPNILGGVLDDDRFNAALGKLYFKGPRVQY